VSWSEIRCSCLQVARQDLCKSEANAAALRVIDSSLFVLVLDDYIPSDIHAAAANMLHGVNELTEPAMMQVGSCLNRWHDKLQLIVCADGTSGLSFEHSVIDGHTALRFTADIYSETIISFAESIVDLIHGRGRITHVLNATVNRAANVVACQEKGGRSLDVLPKKLVFDISQQVLDHISFAEAALCDEIHASDTYVLEYQEYGKRLIVANNMSPDAFVQMSILLAYYKLYGRVDCMYEPALTKQFFHGRTEAIRGATVQAKELCRVWCNQSSTSAQKLDALRRATVEHSRLTKEAASGQGVDRHLFALKSIALRNNIPVPPFFRSEAWRLLNHTILSTSNCGNPALRLFGFGPVVSDGFGIGYIIKDDAISYSVSSKHRQTRRYVRSLQLCLVEMKALLEPISSVAVQRPTLSRVRDVMAKETQSFVAYGDIWGESNLPEVRTSGDSAARVASMPRPGLSNERTSSSQYFSRVSECNIRTDLADVPTIEVLLDSDEEAGTSKKTTL
jgi:carnitine O-acetyltransferase